MAWEPVAEVPALGESACQVWWACPGEVTPGHLAMLDPAERDRHGRYLRAQDRDRFAAGVAMTRLVLAALTGLEPGRVPLDRSCATCGKPHGPPRLTGFPQYRRLGLSVSHSGDRVVLAVAAGGAVGVDVELPGPSVDIAAVASYVLAAEELALLRQLPPPEQPAGFASYWVRKEAVVKATGDGLRARLAGLVVSDPMAGPRLLRWDERPDVPGRVTLRTLSPGGGYAACVALLDQRAAAVSELSGSALLQAWGQRAAPARPRP